MTQTGVQPLVATTLNPSGNLAYQKRCADAWCAAGFEFRSFNAAQEAAALRDAGFDPGRIESLEPDEDARSLFGKPLPRVLSVLRRLAEQSRDRPVLLVNADLYPAVRSARVCEFWSRLAPALALTRLECVSLTPGALRRADSYRGGLDAFHFAPGSLARVIGELEKFAVSERMAFGIPGWDYLVGGVVRSDSVGGRIMDSGLLCHLVHEQSYSALDELEHYRSAFESLRVADARSLSGIAEQFAALIRSDCRRGSVDTRLAVSIFCCWPSEPDFSERELELASDLADSIRRRWPRVADGVGFVDYAAAVRAVERGRAVMASVGNSLVSSCSRLVRFAQVLHAVAWTLETKFGRTMLHASEAYPEGNQHAPALENIIARHPDSDPDRRLHVAWLFGTELIDYGIFNRRLYNWLALTCRNEDERSLLRAIAERTAMHGADRSAG